MFLLAPGFPGRSHSASLDGAVATAVAAEDAGFDDVWIAEHHFTGYGLCPSSVTMAGYLLGATRRLHVATAVAVLPTRHPVALAEETLLLDQLSGGRFHLGVGRGGPWVDLEVFGGGEDAYRDGYPESLEVLLGALRAPSIAGTGPRHRFREVPVVPRPRTDPHPPVTLAATSPTGVAVAAAHGLPMLLGMHVGDSEKAAAVRAYWTAGGPARARHVSTHLAHVEDTTAAARAAVTDALPRWLGPGLAAHTRLDGAPARTRDPVEYTRLLCDLHPVGSPAFAARRLGATVAETGIDRLLLMTETTGDTARNVENVRRLGAEVLPGLRARVASATDAAVADLVSLDSGRFGNAGSDGAETVGAGDDEFGQMTGSGR